MSYAVDLRPIIDQVVFPILEGLAGPFAAILVAKVGQLLHVKMTEAQAKKVEVAIWNGIHFALGKAQEQADAHSRMLTKSEKVAIAVNYVIPKVPAAIKTLKMSDKGLTDRIFARLSALEAEQRAPS